MSEKSPYIMRLNPVQKSAFREIRANLESPPLPEMLRYRYALAAAQIFRETGEFDDVIDLVEKSGRNEIPGAFIHGFNLGTASVNPPFSEVKVSDVHMLELIIAGLQNKRPLLDLFPLDESGFDKFSNTRKEVLKRYRDLNAEILEQRDRILLKNPLAGDIQGIEYYRLVDSIPTSEDNEPLKYSKNNTPPEPDEAHAHNAVILIGINSGQLDVEGHPRVVTRIFGDNGEVVEDAILKGTVCLISNDRHHERPSYFMSAGGAVRSRLLAGILLLEYPMPDFTEEEIQAEMQRIDQRGQQKFR